VLLSVERESIVVVCRRMIWDHLVVGTAGNVSVRVGDQLAVTPSGVGYDELTPGTVGVHRLDGTPVEAPYAPTSELPLHLAVYAATGAAAIVHTHSVAATALSCLVDAVPAVHYYAALFGGVVRVAPYAEYGTDELAERTVVALDGRTACLLANHGAITVGDSLTEAYDRALYLEWLCEVALRTISSGLRPRLLDEAQLESVAARLATYGQQELRTGEHL
jgi:L-fuculose-phosphate aldolase